LGAREDSGVGAGGSGGGGGGGGGGVLLNLSIWLVCSSSLFSFLLSSLPSFGADRLKGPLQHHCNTTVTLL
jgi:hypothetical protein